jgi:hypothetical protein
MPPQGGKMSWTQPICEACWNERNPEREAVRVTVQEDAETCCYCGEHTSSGIFVRVDPKTVKFAAA